MKSNTKDKKENFEGDSTVKYTTNKKYILAIFLLFLGLSLTYITSNLLVYLIENFELVLCIINGVYNKKNNNMKIKEIVSFCNSKINNLVDNIEKLKFINYLELIKNNRQSKLLFILLTILFLVSAYIILDHTYNGISLGSLFYHGGYLYLAVYFAIVLLTLLILPLLSSSPKIFNDATWFVKLGFALVIFYNLYKVVGYINDVNSTVGYQAIFIGFIFMALIFLVLPKFGNDISLSFLAFSLFVCLPILGHLLQDSGLNFNNPYVKYVFIVVGVLYLPTIVSHIRQIKPTQISTTKLTLS